MNEKQVERLRQQLVNEVTGHMPASLYRDCPEAEWYVRGSAKWGFDEVIRPVLELDESTKGPS